MRATKALLVDARRVVGGVRTCFGESGSRKRSEDVVDGSKRHFLAGDCAGTCTYIQWVFSFGSVYVLVLVGSGTVEWHTENTIHTCAYDVLNIDYLAP